MAANIQQRQHQKHMDMGLGFVLLYMGAMLVTGIVHGHDTLPLPLRIGGALLALYTFWGGLRAIKSDGR